MTSAKGLDAIAYKNTICIGMEQIDTAETPGISASPSEDNMRYFNVMILGPTQSPCEDGSHFLTGSLDKSAKLWDTRRLTLIKTYVTKRPVNAVAMSPLLDHVKGQPESIVQDIENMVRSYIEKQKRLSALLNEDPAIMERQSALAKRLELYRSAQAEIDTVAWSK
ncbi:hypothetical protein GOBAR_AA22882 [Gossypium barbadense]|uniref:Serine-threonine kinase receptor-associated protein n=1 Tax=Gossypium barbadense TaxID=3634 RepID=A0A2P5X372_GOSBA|nr:hypothetical protein GOBAR_AA22882 [Gossypium barbadense]